MGMAGVQMEALKSIIASEQSRNESLLTMHKFCALAIKEQEATVTLSVSELRLVAISLNLAMGLSFEASGL